MARLLFINEEGQHEYTLDGEVLPSVSEVTRFISREVYGEVTQYILENAADRGTRVHKACEALDEYGAVEADEDILPYLQAYVLFRREHTVKWEKVEYSSYSPSRKYAGTIDRYGVVDGVRCIVDLKTSSSLQKALYGAGQNLYRMMLEEQGMPVEKLFILHLQKDGSYKIVELAKDDSVALACLTLHNALKKKPRKKKAKE